VALPSLCPALRGARGSGCSAQGRGRVLLGTVAGGSTSAGPFASPGSARLALRDLVRRSTRGRAARASSWLCASPVPDMSHGRPEFVPTAPQICGSTASLRRVLSGTRGAQRHRAVARSRSWRRPPPAL